MPPRSADDATREAALAVLIAQLGAQTVRVGDGVQDLVAELRESAAAQRAAAERANPWAVAHQVASRIPPWGLVLLLAIPMVIGSAAAAPVIPDLLTQLTARLAPAAP